MQNPETRSICDHIPQTNQPARELYATASEYRRLATTAATITELQAFDALATRFTSLAEGREAQERMAVLGPNRPLGLPSPRALEMATAEVGRGYILPENTLNPAVASSVLTMAYDLMAYGLVPPEPDIAAMPSSSPCRASKHILLVDDTPDVLVAVGAFLAREGVVVLSAADGDTALRLIASDPQISILITDYVMPGLSGVELIAQALQLRPNLKALLITSYPGADGLSELPAHIKLLTKPFRRAALMDQVKMLVGETSPMAPGATMEPAGYAPT